MMPFVLSVTNVALLRLLADYRRHLTLHLGERLVELKLFGSYARGEARTDSDVDVAVVLDRIDSHADRVLPMQLSGDLILEHGLVIRPIVFTVGELDALRKRELLLAQNLDREGIAI
jgi:predicted nucleotidyltransferase